MVRLELRIQAPAAVSC